MATIEKSFKTQATAQDMKDYVNDKLLSRGEIAAFVDSKTWIGNTLHIESKLGKGVITLRDNEVHVAIDLNLLGRAAKGSLEAAFDKGFKMLEAPKK